MKDTPEEDIEWEDVFEAVLVKRGMEVKAAEECAEEALAHCAESGEGPTEAFGDPKQYAETIATGRIPVAQRARRDYDDVGMDEHWGAPLTLPAGCLFLFGVVLCIREGLWLDVTLAVLVGTALLGLALALAGGAQALRAAGFTRAWIAAACVALAMSVPVAVALFELPHEKLGRIPAPSLFVAALLVNWVGERLERPGTLERRTAERLVALVTGRGRATAPDTEIRRWLARLQGLLRGRHYVGRSETRRLVADARQHLEATGARPQDEFGDAERYALSLVEEGGARRPTRKAALWPKLAAYFVVCGVVVIDTDWDDPGFYEYLNPAVMAAVGWWLVKNYRERWSDRSARSPAEG